MVCNAPTVCVLLILLPPLSGYKAWLLGLMAYKFPH